VDFNGISPSKQEFKVLSPKIKRCSGFMFILLPEIQPTMDNGQRYGKTIVAL
jgi:hypothetical protein